ncbi:MAG: hypothetical protein EOP42_13335 [Sphingobacteriaceae bacterium]|nr:MAG: hypothetical protein EOP42_13335 [Sphingobacteriaceae bacterium]
MFIQIVAVITLIIIIFYLRKIQDILIEIRVDLSDHTSKKAEVNYWISKANKNKLQEHEALLSIVFNELLNPLITPQNRKTKYDELKTLYENDFRQLGFEFPEYLFLNE